MRYQPNYYLACRIQDKILNMIGIETQQKKNFDPKSKKDLKPGELASLTKAFDLMEDRKRILRNKGLPKPLDSEVKPKGPVHTSFRE
jgi:hypothetical protein